MISQEDFKSDEEHQIDIPMTVLVNQYSASASEIFAGAIQDYDLGAIVGTQTYGKGVVQQIFDLKDGTCVKLSVLPSPTDTATINSMSINTVVKQSVAPYTQVNSKRTEIILYYYDKKPTTTTPTTPTTPTQPDLPENDDDDTTTTE